MAPKEDKDRCIVDIDRPHPDCIQTFTDKFATKEHVCKIDKELWDSPAGVHDTIRSLQRDVEALSKTRKVAFGFLIAILVSVFATISAAFILTVWNGYMDNLKNQTNNQIQSDLRIISDKLSKMEYDSRTRDDNAKTRDKASIKRDDESIIRDDDAIIRFNAKKNGDGGK